MIFTDRTIIVQKGTSSINDTIILYRGDKGVEIRFTLNEGSPFRFGSGTSPNIIEKTEAAYGQLIIKAPNGLPSIFSEIAPTNGGKIVFTITAEMINEITEVGNYTFQIRLFDENRESRATLPEVIDGIEIREPIATEDVTDTNEAGVATVGYALTTAGTSEDVFDSQGNYNKTTWGPGDRITDAKLNKIEAGIDGVNKKVASGGTGGTVDLSGYVTKETGNANQITFTDGQTFQAKLDAGTLKGDKGDKGEQGEVGAQGPKGDKGADGVTTSIVVNGNTYTHVDGVITLPNYPTNVSGGGTIPDNVVLFEETTETPIIQETSIPINSQNGTTYYIKVDDNGALSVQNVNGETVWSGGGQDVVAATSLTLDKTSKTIMVSETFTLTPTIEPVDCTQTLKWHTNNATIATVDNGVVTGQGIGNCTITAKIGNCTATCDVTVQKFVLLIWNSGPANDNITGGWDYTTKADYSYLDENGNYVLKNSNGNWTTKHFVTKNAIDLSKYSKLILTLEVEGSGECKCETSDDGTSVTSTYKYLKVNSSTTEYIVDITELTNTTRLSFNNYGTQVIIKKIGLE